MNTPTPAPDLTARRAHLLDQLAALDALDGDAPTRHRRDLARAAYAAVAPPAAVTPYDAAEALADAEAIQAAAVAARDSNLAAWDAFTPAALRAFVLAQPGEPWTDPDARIDLPLMYDEDGTYITDAAAYDEDADVLPALDLLDGMNLRDLPAHVGEYDGPADAFRLSPHAVITGPPRPEVTATT